MKPANLLLADDETIRVSDFGIARAAGQDTLTEPGSVLGSVGYMAPEQARGEPTSPASDRYALACVAFELLTGRRPFERESPAAEATAHAREAGAVGARPRARAYRQRSTPSSRAGSPSGPRSGTRPAQRLSLTCARGPHAEAVHNDYGRCRRRR